MTSVFVSYKSSNDMQRIKNVVNHLREVATSVYFAPDDLFGGEYMPITFRTAIASHDVFVALLAPGYTESSWCIGEYNYAVHLEKQIVLVSIDKTFRPKELSKYYIIDYEDEGFAMKLRSAVNHTPIGSNKSNRQDYPLLQLTNGRDARVIACEYVIEWAERLRRHLQKTQQDDTHARFLWDTLLLLSGVIQDINWNAELEKNYPVLEVHIQHIFYENPTLKGQLEQIDKVIQRAKEIIRQQGI
ncbi:MAG: toll/interleukin-1 receptor domain-containing protein [Chloroflexi bacterium]|nr:toll/interleukin-1 receptor domain-containing protein [Chloroflexota bacterium]